MCVFDNKVAVGGVPAVAVVSQEVGVGGLGAGGDNGPAHTPASRGTHMHACMLGTTCMHGALLPAGPTGARLPRTSGTVAHHRSARRCFSSFSIHVFTSPF